MTLTYCMTSNCPLARTCLRYEDDAARHALRRSYADFSEELVRNQDGGTTCLFYLAKAQPD